MSGISTLGDCRLANNFCLQWNKACPSCFQCDFDDPLPAIGPVFSSLQPSVERASIVLHDCDVLDDITGKEINEEIHIDVISFAPLMSLADLDAFKFRAADKSEHTNYCTFGRQLFAAPIGKRSSTGSSFVPLETAQRLSLSHSYWLSQLYYK
jgi:hypothetical protein